LVSGQCGGVRPNRALAAAFRQRVSRYKHELGLSTQEAVAKAEERCTLARLWEVQGCAPEDLTWDDLQETVGPTGERAADRWEEVQQAAREAVQGGHWAASAVEGRRARPWQRALFLAVREELARGWGPLCGVERQLVDHMAQAQAAMYFFQELLFARLDHLPDLAEQAAAMADRFSRMFARTLRALQNLRRHAPPVVVRNAGQVNVGHQQLNVSTGGARG
jgi:hypothetical protein